MKQRSIPIAFALIVLAALIDFSCKSSTEVQQPPNPVSYDAQGNVQMAPPDSADGIQLEIQPFVVPNGSEVQRNYYMKLPSDVPFYVDRIQVAMNPGTHHMNIFVGNPGYDKPDGYEDSSFYDQSVFQDANLMIEAQQPYLDWSTPKDVGIPLQPRQQLIVQVHYVNGTTSQATPNGMGKVLINLYRAKSTPSQISSMLFAQKRSLLIPPHTDSTYTKYCLLDSVPRPLQIIAMTGHFHSRGKSFIVERFDTKASRIIDTIYKSTDWDEPPFKSYVDAPIYLEDGQCLRYDCHYVNTSDDTVHFGPRTDINEHMNLFMWFVPGYNHGQSIFDFN